MTTQTANGRIDSVSRIILAAPPTIYQAFLNPASLAQWLPPQGMAAQIDLFEPRPGGQFRITLTYELDPTIPGKTAANQDVLQGRFLELVPNQKIVQAGHFETDDPVFSGEMVETWYLEAVPGGTKVTIVIENVPAGIRKTDHLEGLTATLDNLAGFTER